MLVVVVLSVAFALACSDGHISTAGPISAACSVMTHTYGSASGIVASATLALFLMVAAMLPLAHARSGPSPLIATGTPFDDTSRSYAERSRRLRL